MNGLKRALYELKRVLNEPNRAVDVPILTVNGPKRPLDAYLVI